MNELTDIQRARQRREQRTVKANQAAYEVRELTDARRQLEALRRQPARDRKEFQEALYQMMQEDPALVAERAAWLLAGHYGYGPMALAKCALSARRINRVAALTQLIGAFEWRVPEELARAAWKRLAPAAQTRLDSAIAAVITAADADEA